MRCLAFFISTVLAASAWAIEVNPPILAQVYVPGKTRNESVMGDLIRYDDQTLTITTRGGERTLRWDEITPTSAYVLRARLIDKDSAQDWLALGQFAWDLGAKEQARTALGNATKIDASLREQANAILKSVSKAQSMKPAPASKPVEEELLQPLELTATPSAGTAKYEISTPEQNSAAIASARIRAMEIAQQLNVTFVEVQTDHFLIFTDWDPAEHTFLRENLEAAYAAVSKQFEIPVNENIFVGKLPVYMHRQRRSFDTLAGIDGVVTEQGTAGYFQSIRTGIGHMSMWKPVVVGNSTRQAELTWAYVLTHEFTHAFVARYRSNRNVPAWLNEGVAELIAANMFPRINVRRAAREEAARQASIQRIFNQNRFPGEWYPVAQTLVETLMAKDPKKLVTLFDRIKEGKDAEDALKEVYEWDYEQFEAAWRYYLKNVM